MFYRLELISARRACRRASLLALACMLIALWGCSASRSERNSLAEVPYRALVLPSEDMTDGAYDLFAGWEYGRNDATLNHRPDARIRPEGWAEIYTRDRLYTHDGSPREYSRYEVRTYRTR